MKIDAELLVRLRNERSWSQDELAAASGLNLRTIQRVERDGSASLQSKKALAAALDIDTHDLDEKALMHPCPICRSTEIYEYKTAFSLSGEELLPGLGSHFLSAKIRPWLCVTCGNVQFFASEEAKKKVKTAKHWKAVSA
ncbi:MAG: helix-turn-helix transcriptional regulator [Bauldia sp.]|nr:helix-turn-helix transcriptional regulator [Bauldia sp.]MCW5717374.1 helix-turn-helix transcriptional regulator [Bauldia sp.]